MEQIEGRHPVLAALEAGRVERLWIAEGRAPDAPLMAAAKAAGVTPERLDEAGLARRARTKAHQGVIARVRERQAYAVADLLEIAAARGEPPLLLLCDQVQDPQNIGSLLRSADAAGCHGLIVTERRAAPMGAAAAKASAGAIEHVAVAEVVNLVRAMDELKAAGVWIAAADAEAPQSMWEADLSGPLAIAVGNEGAGLRRLVRERCDFAVRIPMFGRVPSLNAAVSGALLLYEAARRRAGKSDIP
ncbi:MAG TPA: 23S rRNA (guanosine(2251)-2'-O)-methyltransferase RlmB [Limnochordia bacterium]|nr:23S rRNA (guanosine(2251)-2'-O)-methyltransferase RlmB [Limnochordia bacterium]